MIDELSASGEPTVPLRYLPAVGGQPVNLGLDAAGKLNLRLDPTGQRVAYTVPGYAAEIWIMEHFLTDLAMEW